MLQSSKLSKISSTMHRRRLFIGVALNKELSNIIQFEQSSLQKKSQTKFIAPENLHITLLPPFYACVKEIDRIKVNLHNLEKNFKLFKIKFDKIETGPSQRHPRLIWISGKSSKEFNILKAQLQSQSQVSDKHKDRVPHITIARFKRNYGPQPTQIIKKDIKWTFQADNITVFESILGPKGAQYKKLISINLSK